MDGHLFTCMSCSIAFTSPEEQRTHYRSDHHRYNMKRRVAGLPPVSALAFNQKVLDRRQETAVMTSPKGTSCEICGKAYTTENAYRSHVNSKKHKENEVKAAQKALNPTVISEKQPEATPIEVQDTVESAVVPPVAQSSEEPVASTSQPSESMDVDEEDDEDINMTIDQKIAAARTRLSPDTNCLFCTQTSTSLSANLLHMSSVHSFFIPDAEYLTDPAGLITYLGEKIAVGNVCIYCSTSSREFRSLEAVRKHMIDKSHCKIAYSSEKDKLEISDFYDFSTSYPDYAIWKERTVKGKGKKALVAAEEEEDAEWESDDETGDVDEVIEVVEDSASGSDDSDTESDEDPLPENTISYGDTQYELILPSGTRIGHRAKRYHKQRQLAAPYASSLTTDGEEPKGAALVRKMLADKNSCLVPVRGDFGAFGRGTQVVKARNRGEAKEARRHVKEFRDQKRREDFRTKIGYRGNSQKHYRDPLLQ